MQGIYFIHKIDSLSDMHWTTFSVRLDIYTLWGARTALEDNDNCRVILKFWKKDWTIYMPIIIEFDAEDFVQFFCIRKRIFCRSFSSEVFW